VALCWIIVHFHLFSHGALLHCISDTIADNWTAQRHARSVAEVSCPSSSWRDRSVYHERGTRAFAGDLGGILPIWGTLASRGRGHSVYNVARQVSPGFGEPPLDAATDKENSWRASYDWRTSVSRTRPASFDPRFERLPRRKVTFKRATVRAPDKYSSSTNTAILTSNPLFSAARYGQVEG
jgi:hypothetical protein